MRSNNAFNINNSQPLPYQAYVSIDLFKHIFVLVKHTVAKQQSRTALKHLNKHQLKDIGLTKQQAMQEANKYFWQ